MTKTTSIVVNWVLSSGVIHWSCQLQVEVYRRRYQIPRTCYTKCSGSPLRRQKMRARHQYCESSCYVAQTLVTVVPLLNNQIYCIWSKYRNKHQVFQTASPMPVKHVPHNKMMTLSSWNDCDEDCRPLSTIFIEREQNLCFVWPFGISSDRMSVLQFWVHLLTDILERMKNVPRTTCTPLAVCVRMI